MIHHRRVPPHPDLLGTVQDITEWVAKVIATYRQKLQDEGVGEAEAWALAQRLEERLLGPIFDDAEAELKPAPWTDIEALFIAVVNLQLILGQAPNAFGAVQYMRDAGVKVPAPTGEQVALLAVRTPLSAEEIQRAFRLTGPGPRGRTVEG